MNTLVIEPPVTAIEVLKGHLYHYRRFSSELAELEKKIGQARAEESAPLDNLGLNDDEAAGRLTKIQACKKSTIPISLLNAHRSLTSCRASRVRFHSQRVRREINAAR